MNDNILTPPTLINRQSDLEALAQSLQGEARLAVDTESNSLFAYHERVCLIQFSTAQADYLVDPLALEDLSPLAPIFNDPQLEKVFHAAEYDLIGLRRDFGFTFNNLFDTMMAARILGRPAVGLGALLEEEFGIHLDKRHQRANWGQRPLPAHLVDYARLDTHYLIPLRDRLHETLEQRGLLPLATEDLRRLEKTEGNGHLLSNGRAADCWRVSGSYDLEPQQAAVLQELCRYREDVARSLNRPLFKVLGDQALLAIAIAAPRNAEQLRRVPGINLRQVDRHGQGLLKAVKRGLRAAPLHPPRSRRPEESYLQRLEGLRRWRKAAAEKMGVASDVILPRDLMFALAQRNPRDEAELSQVMVEAPWRFNEFGAQILQAMAPKEQV